MFGASTRALAGRVVAAIQCVKLPTVWRFALSALNLMPHLPHCHKCSRAHLLRHTNNAAGHLSRHTQILMATNGLATCPHTHTHTHLAVHIERDFKVLLTIWQFPPDLAQRTHARARCVAHVRERNLFATCTIHAANGMQHCRGREKRNK